MIVFYSLSIWIYSLLIRVVSPFNTKAKQWIDGRRNILDRVSESISNNDDIAWFHAASLGEFEQGRPVMEEFKLRYPKYKILLTFFSPSGYEIRKDYEGVDYIFYLPIDSKSNASKFIDIVKPKVVFFIKYEFWFFYLKQLRNRDIPTYIFSSIFREEQLFFKWYGGWYRKMLTFFDKIYVQDDNSKRLLDSINIHNVEVGGDTRFDRVYSIAKSAKEIDLVEQFARNQFVVIGGSTWEKDEEIIAKYANSNNNKGVKWIIAPHEIHGSHIRSIEKLFELSVLKFSEATKSNINDAEVLIIDNIGILSSLYRYCDIAYIGGGFGKGIHNTLEAATYGLPVVFGSNYKQFREACDLIKLSSGFPISKYDDFKIIMDTLFNDEILREKSGKSALDYINKMRGGTLKILAQLPTT